MRTKDLRIDYLEDTREKAAGLHVWPYPEPTQSIGSGIISPERQEALEKVTKRIRHTLNQRNSRRQKDDMGR